MKVINLGLVSHVDAGKTTTTEQILFQTGSLRNAGRVDDGNTQTDYMEVERTRGISVRASSVYTAYRDIQLNLIDTPGHTDFAGEVERSLCVLDGAVLIISAAEGLQGYTETLWRSLKALKKPTIVFLNKCDRLGSEPYALLEELKEQLEADFLPLHKVSAYGGRDVNVPEISLQNENALLMLADLDDALAEKYINGEEVLETSRFESLKKLTNEQKLFPIVFGVASMGVGIQALLEAIVRLFPCHEMKREGEPLGVIYKIEHDPKMGKCAHVRLYEGSLSNRESVKLTHLGGGEPYEGKITQIRRVWANKGEDTGVLLSHDIGAVYGLTDAKTGDYIGARNPAPYASLPVSLFSVQVLPKTAEELPKLVTAINELSDEDPLLDVYWSPDERELHIKIMGEVQLEILTAIIKERYNLEVSFSKPSVIYKETVTKKGIGFEAYTMPKPCWAVIKLELEPLPLGSGVQFESVVSDRDILYRYQHHIETAVPRALEQGLYGWEVTDVKVTLIEGQHHLIHTHPLDFFVATPMAVMNGLENCGTTLLEPLIKMRITADESLLGKVLGEITQMRGRFDTPLTKNGSFTLDAILPVSTSMTFPVRLASLSGGKAISSTVFYGYQPCPIELGAATKRRGIDPRDRSKWILHARSAL